MEYSEIDKELKQTTKNILKEYRKTFTSKPTHTGDTDLSPSADYLSFTSSTIIDKPIENGYEEMAAETFGSDSKKWKNMKNKLDKMDWEQPEPNPSDFQSKDVQDIASKEQARLNHNKSSYKKAYKKHELPDNQGFSHLEKMNTKDDKTKGDPLLWSYYRQYFRPQNRMKK